MTNNHHPMSDPLSDPMSLSDDEIALIRAYTAGVRRFHPAYPTTETYDAHRVQKAVEQIAAHHGVSLADLVGSVSGTSDQALARRVLDSYERHFAHGPSLEDAIDAARQDPATIVQQMYAHGRERHLIPDGHDMHAVQNMLAAAAQTWTRDLDANTLRTTALGDLYVALRLREEGDDADTLLVPLVTPEVCDHGATLCGTPDCIWSWSNDWQIVASQSNIHRLMHHLIAESAQPPVA